MPKIINQWFGKYAQNNQGKKKLTPPSRIVKTCKHDFLSLAPPTPSLRRGCKLCTIKGVAEGALTLIFAQNYHKNGDKTRYSKNFEKLNDQISNSSLSNILCEIQTFLTYRF